MPSAQHTIGNNALQVHSPTTHFDFGNIRINSTTQAKLRVNHRGDAYEQEADRVAEEVMRMSSITKASSSLPLMTQNITNDMDEVKVGRKCNSCEMKDKEEEEQKMMMNISRKASPRSPSDGMNALEIPENIASSINNIRSNGGSPLDASTRGFME